MRNSLRVKSDAWLWVCLLPLTECIVSSLIIACDKICFQKVDMALCDQHLDVTFLVKMFFDYLVRCNYSISLYINHQKHFSQCAAVKLSSLQLPSLRAIF